MSESAALHRRIADELAVPEHQVTAAVLAAPRRPDPSQLEAVSRAVLAETTGATALDVMRAVDAQHRVTRPVGLFLTRYDLLLTPTLGQLPAPHGTLDHDNRTTQPGPGWRGSSSTARSRRRSTSRGTRLPDRRGSTSMPHDWRLVTQP